MFFLHLNNKNLINLIFLQYSKESQLCNKSNKFTNCTFLRFLYKYIIDYYAFKLGKYYSLYMKIKLLSRFKK